MLMSVSMMSVPHKALSCTQHPAQEKNMAGSPKAHLGSLILTSDITDPLGLLFV